MTEILQGDRTLKISCRAGKIVNEKDNYSAITKNKVPAKLKEKVVKFKLNPRGPDLLTCQTTQCL